MAILTCVHQGTIRMHFLSSQHNGLSIIPWRNFKILKGPYSGPYPGHGTKSIYVAYIYILDTYRRNDNRRSNKRRRNKRRKKTSLEKYLPLTLFVRFACERVLETENKLHILTPLLWPSRCAFLVLLLFNWRPRAHSIGAFPRAPSVGCGLPYYIWSLLSGILLATALGPKLNWVK